MSKHRLEAFSDGVFAIIITIMVLDLKAPHRPDWEAIAPLIPPFLSYVLSFVFVGIYWNNHHHLFQAVHHINGRILWANLHLLFWLSLIPLVTHWMGNAHFMSLPVAAYGVVMLLAGFAYWILIRSLIRQEGRDSTLAKAIGRDYKGYLSLAIYSIAIPLCFVHPTIGGICYILVALMWLIPDQRIERVLPKNS